MESYYSEYTANATGKTYRVFCFDTIDNPTDAYFIGLMAMDGGYSEAKQKYPRMSLSSNNKQLITDIRDRYCVGVNVIDRSERVVSVQNRTYQNESYELHFPVGVTRSLANFGIARHKPERTMVRIPNQYLSAYLLGIIDGDGSIVVRHRKDCRAPRLNIHIVSGALLILAQIQRLLESDWNIASSIYEQKETYSELRINNTTRAVQFCSMIYSQMPEFYNTKKKDIFDKYYHTYCVD